MVTAPGEWSAPLRAPSATIHDLDDRGRLAKPPRDFLVTWGCSHLRRSDSANTPRSLRSLAMTGRTRCDGFLTNTRFRLPQGRDLDRREPDGMRVARDVPVRRPHSGRPCESGDRA
jgi:hypothetical protein